MGKERGIVEKGGKKVKDLEDALCWEVLQWCWKEGYKTLVKEVGRVRRGRKGVIDKKEWEEVIEKWG